MTLLWISLPRAWDLQDVQAALNVVVTVLSALCIFVFARACWQTATAKVVKNRNVPLAALLSVNTLGEVVDVCRLLGLEILSSYYLRILAQCLVVTGLTVLAFLSGPLVRYSTRWGTRLVFEDVPGLLANRFQSGISHEVVLWNATWDSLDHAGFPEDQLLDFLPNTTSYWKYVPGQWNSTWSMECQFTENTHIELTALGESVCTENTTLNDEIPALETIFPENALRKDKNHSRVYDSFEGISDSSTNYWRQGLYFRTGYTFAKYDNDTGIYAAIDVTLLSLHMQGIPPAPDNSSDCYYGHGPVESATYTKAFCALRKVRQNPDGISDIAYPDNNSLDFLSEGYTSYFQGRFMREAIAKSHITVITPRDLLRFYQVYLITQDTQYKHPVVRKLNREVQVVKVSTIFLIVCSVFVLLCIFGILRYGVFTLRHYKAVDRTPQSKLDWMIQSIAGNKAGTPLIPTRSGRRPRHSVTSTRSPDIGSPTAGRRRSDFETATYGSSPEPSTPHHMNWLSRQSSGGSYFPLQQAMSPPEASDTSLLERYPTAPAGPLGSGPFGNDYYVHR